MNFKIEIDELRNYIIKERCLYASGAGKRFYVSLTNSFIVKNMKTKEEYPFFSMEQAVNFFNELIVE